MNPNPLLAFLLSFCPGLGHLYLNRKLRAFLYAVPFFGLLFLAVFYFNFINEDSFVLVLLFAAFIVWGINLLDVIMYLISPNRRNQPIQSGSYGGYTTSGA